MSETQLKEDISKIIHDGITAPSGENSQPWRFVVDNNVIYVLNVVGRDTTLYNSGQHGSYVAHGALIENIVISASHYGYMATVECFPSEVSTPVAKITLTKAVIAEDPLYSALATRSTNRNIYRLDKISDENKKSLIEEGAKLGMGSFIIVDDDKQMDILSEASAAVEKLMFINKPFHKFFYDHFFSRQRDENKPTGFYIETLGLSSFTKFGIGITRPWFIASLFRYLGIDKVVASMRSTHYRKSGAFGAVLSTGDTHIDYIHAGRVMERVWLRATLLGLSLQPCVGVLYLWEGVMKSAESIFGDKEQGIIDESRNKILEVFGVRGQTMPMFFRMGYGIQPPIRSFRFEPEIEYLS